MVNLLPVFIKSTHFQKKKKLSLSESIEERKKKQNERQIFSVSKDHFDLISHNFHIVISSEVYRFKV